MATDDLDPTVQYDPSGDEVYDFTASDFGTQPDWKKEDLIGQRLIIRGLSEDTFTSGTFPPARSIRYSVELDNYEEVWGMLYSDTSAIVGQVRKALQKGKVPFIATLNKKPSNVNRGQSYWILEPFKPAAPVADTKGRK